MSPSSSQVWPCTLGPEFIHDFLEGLFVDMWATELVADDLLDLGGVERNDVLLKHVHVHVCVIYDLGHRWVRLF